MAHVITSRKKTTKKKSVETIKLKDINETWGAIQHANKVIKAGLSRHVIFNEDPLLITYHSLRIFSFGRKKYGPDDRESIVKQCIVILQKYGIYSNGKVEDTFHDKDKYADNTPIGHFIKYIVGLHEMPFHILSQLETQVKSNLKELLSLIAFYEADAIIISYKKGVHRREHKSKLIIDFYERCIAEKDVIIKYLINDLEDRAIIKASQDKSLKDFGLMWFEGYWDRPYKWWQYRSIEYFDYRQINVCRHRLDEVSVRDIPQMEDLYKTNKKLFYHKLKKYLSVEQIFHEIENFYIPTLPKVIERKPVFDELKKLIKARRWYAFTALALTQVEGVFSDMLYILYPQKNYSSLSTKVFAVRPHYTHEERNFDYFEYHLPFLRNSFLHSGNIKDKDFTLLSKDLIYDLHYLLRVFHVISDAHMELHKMLKKNSTEIISGIKSFNHIFGLVAEVQERSIKNSTHKELKETLKAWFDFEKDILKPSTELEDYLNLETEDFDNKLVGFFETIKAQTAYHGQELDIAAVDMKYITTNLEKIKQTHGETLSSFREEYENIMDILEFIEQYKKFLPSTSIDVVNYLADIKKRHKSNFTKLTKLKPVFHLE